MIVKEALMANLPSIARVTATHFRLKPDAEKGRIMTLKNRNSRGMRINWKAEEPVSAGTKGEAMQTIPPKMWKMQRGQRRPYLHEMLVLFHDSTI